MAKKLEKSQWSVYFDLISKALTGELHPVPKTLS
jgi:hypothetical protein